MPFATSDGVKLHYWQVGTGPDLTLLHGLGGNLAVWHFATVPQLRAHYRTLTYDLRGHGRSDRPPTGYTTRDGAHDLRGLLDSLGIERTHLAGHSFGADVALHFALLWPERVKRLVVIDAMMPVMLKSYRREDFEGWAYWAQLVKQMTGIEVPRERWQDIEYMLTLSFQIPILFGPFRGRERDKGPITSLLTGTSILKDFDNVQELIPENLHRITPPTLLLYEHRSPFMETFEVLRDYLPNAEAVILPESDLRHFSPLQQPEAILEQMKRFLAAGDAPGPETSSPEVPTEEQAHS